MRRAQMLQTQIQQHMTTIKTLVAFCIFNIATAKAQEMKKINLPNGHVVFSLSDKEEAIARGKLTLYKELRRDTVEDKIYEKEDRVFVLYRTDDNRLLFDFGQIKFFTLTNESTYDYYLSNERLYQMVHSMDFVTPEVLHDFIKNMNGRIDDFCLRKKINRGRLSLDMLEDDIINGNRVYQFFLEQIAVFCFLKSEQGFEIETLELNGSKKSNVITMVNKGGKRITPAQLVAKMYEKIFIQ